MKATMRIRDCHATRNGDELIQTMPSGGLEIVGDDGRTLFSVRLKDGQLQVMAGGVCKHEGKMLDDRISIIPHSSNHVSIVRPVYESI